MPERSFYPGPLLHQLDESRDLARDVNAVVPGVAVHTRYAALHPCTGYVAE